MAILTAILYILHVVVSFFLILVVLLQQGKGADLSVFGGGSTQAAFGARGAATLFHKLTVAGFLLFTLTTLSIAIVEGRKHGSTTSVMKEDMAKTEATKPAEPAATEPAASTTTAPVEGAAAPAEAVPPATESAPAATPAETGTPAPPPTGT
ncbi:MAG TPA: preprotein translocase subunit SecG [Thermoanaerobaculia bacterium]|nr:preprotein translocase subunit SecG [Thermoanaerobaculia bacterium]